jgi:hypothetical protein
MIMMIIILCIPTYFSRFNGSTLEVIGNFYAAKDGQMAIVGGTGEFVSAHGVIKYKKVQQTSVDTHREFNISAFYDPATVSTSHTLLPLSLLLLLHPSGSGLAKP